MVPRGRLDITWRQLLYAAAACAWPASAATASRRAAAAWSPAGDALPCFSVRSGLDLVLRALALPRGGRVLVSAVTIPDIAHIVEHHGLLPVPVDLDMTTLGVTRDALDRACRPGTVAVLVAHLFGSRMPMDDVLAFARERGLLVLEDCAQAYEGQYRGHPDADVSFFSFGTIKTSTALGGAILRFRDRELMSRVAAIQQSDPPQARLAQLRRVVRHAAIKLVTWPQVYMLLVGGLQWAGRDIDGMLRAILRGFRPTNDDGERGRFIRQLRRRPSAPLLLLLAHRLRRHDGTRVERRVEVARSILNQLEAVIDWPGADAPAHAYWVLPIYAPTDPEALVTQLRRRGFDATVRGSALRLIAPPPGEPGAIARDADAAMRRVVYLPLDPDMSRRTARRLAQALADSLNERPAEPAPRAFVDAL